MNLIVCIDNNKGMLFNNRRQAQDREVIKDILKNIGQGNLYINEFSKELFSNNSCAYIEKDLLNIEFKENDYCFLENIKPSKFINKISKIITYKWNTNYPADTFLDIDIENWKKEKDIEIKGYSHKIITKCEYVRREK